MTVAWWSGLHGPMIRPVRTAVLILLAGAASNGLFAQQRSPTTVEAALEEVAVALEKEQGLSDETKTALRSLVDALRAEREQTSQRNPESIGRAAEVNTTEIARAVDDYLAKRSPARETPVWEESLERLHVGGDLRLRYEFTDRGGGGADRHRERVRFRLGFTYELSDELQLGGRLVTGDPDDPNSPHVTFGDFFDSFDVSLDRAFVTYRPSRPDGAWITAGKFSHAFRPNPVYGELLWDADVQPEGVAAGYTVRDFGFLDRLDFVVGEYVAVEQANLDEASALVVQIAGQKQLGEHINLFSTLGWYRYTDLDPDGSLLVVADNRGNAIVGDEYVSRFSIVTPTVGFSLDYLPKPLVVSGQFISNTRAADSKGQGWAAGVAYGQTRRSKDWRAYYQYQHIERDAVLSAVAQDDFSLATNFRGHVFGIQYQLTDDIGLHAWALLSERLSESTPGALDEDDDFWRFRLDLNIKF